MLAYFGTTKVCGQVGFVRSHMALPNSSGTSVVCASSQIRLNSPVTLLYAIRAAMPSMPAGVRNVTELPPPGK